MILTSALNRQESRGARRITQRDDANFLKHTMAYYSPAGIDLQYQLVTNYLSRKNASIEDEFVVIVSCIHSLSHQDQPQECGFTVPLLPKPR